MKIKLYKGHQLSPQMLVAKKSQRRTGLRIIPGSRAELLRPTILPIYSFCRFEQQANPLLDQTTLCRTVNGQALITESKGQYLSKCSHNLGSEWLITRRIVFCQVQQQMAMNSMMDQYNWIKAGTVS